MAKKITELVELTAPGGEDLLPIVDTSASATRKITIENFMTGWVGADAMTYTSADDPTYTMTCTGDKTAKYYAGQKIKLSQSTGGTKYFIVTKVAYSDPSTTLTLYGGTDYNLENEAITSPYYSVVKAPFGFPLDPTKWTVELIDTGERVQANPVDGTWYNLGTLSLSIPIGVWNILYQLAIFGYKNSIIELSLNSALSTDNDSVTDLDLIGWTYFVTGTSDNKYGGGTHYREKFIILTSKTIYYLVARSNASSISSLEFRGDFVNTIVRATCAYL